MTKNESYPTYLPAFYVFSAGLYQLGVSDFTAFLSLWRPIGELSHLLLAFWLLVAGLKRGGLAFGVLASCFFYFNRWTIAVVNIAHLDMLALMIWVASLELSDSAHRRYRALSYVLFGLSLAIKQMALLCIPLYLIWEWRLGPRKTAVRRIVSSFTLMAAIPILVSLPFVFWDASGFIKSILFSRNEARCRRLRH